MEQELKTRKSASDFANDSTRNPCSAKFIRQESHPHRISTVSVGQLQ